MSESADDFGQRLFTHLRHNPEVSEYGVLKHLQRAGEPGFPEGLFQDSLLLFRAHFKLFHGLYVLQRELVRGRRYRLDISPLQILLREYRKPTGQALDEADPMRDYYLNPNHLQETARVDVERMLGAFWARFGSRGDQQRALRVLGLDNAANPEQIRRRYRKLAMQHHPDRGGELERFQELQAAMAILSRLG